MRKSVLGLLLALTLLLGASPLASATEEIAVYVDGVAVTDARATDFNGTVYVSLSLVTLALRPDADYQYETDRVVVRGDDLVLSAKVNQCYLTVNDRYLYIPGGVKQHESGDTLVPARVLARALGSELTWDGAVHLTSGGVPLESGTTFYKASDVDLLARVIYHESGNQPFKGQLAVGDVILNRVASRSFPNTIYDVVYQRGQFPGATSKTPDTEAVLAAKICLDGASVVEGAYWFNGAGIPCWASRNKDLVATIGNHAFYG